MLKRGTVWTLVLTFLMSMMIPGSVLGQDIFPPAPCIQQAPIGPSTGMPRLTVPVACPGSSSSKSKDDSGDTSLMIGAAVGGVLLLTLLIAYAVRSSRATQKSEDSQQAFPNIPFLLGFLPRVQNDPLTLSGEIVILRW